jgi:hypothetical protein
LPRSIHRDARPDVRTLGLVRMGAGQEGRHTTGMIAAP